MPLEQIYIYLYITLYLYIIYTYFSKLQNIFGNPVLLSLFKSKNGFAILSSGSYGLRIIMILSQRSVNVMI